MARGQVFNDLQDSSLPTSWVDRRRRGAAIAPVNLAATCSLDAAYGYQHGLVGAVGSFGPYLSTMLSNSAVQATQFIGPIVGVIVGPSVGVFSDRTTSRFGRRRPYLVVAGILSIICWIAMGYTREIGDALGDHGTALPATWTARGHPGHASCGDFAGDRQTTGAALGQAWSTLGSIVVAVYIRAFDLPKVLVVYAIGFFFVQYGYTAYNGNKGQFFGLEIAYNDGVSLAGGDADLAYNIVGYVYSWCLPYLVSKFGLKWVLTLSTVPQMFLIVMAWVNNKGFDVFVVAICGMTSSVWFSCIVPIIIHVMGDDVEIGMYVGALNSANCFGQLLNFAIGTAIVDTSLGYKLPVFIGGIMTALGFVTAAIFMKIKMYSL
ncbi:Major facilitator superfamily domain [Phytophthora cactorum]|nr:Major facilitator superfamily domain [Phytophthora cactorum]